MQFLELGRGAPADPPGRAAPDGRPDGPAGPGGAGAGAAVLGTEAAAASRCRSRIGARRLRRATSCSCSTAPPAWTGDSGGDPSLGRAIAWARTIRPTVPAGRFDRRAARRRRRRPLVDPPSFDTARVDEALGRIKSPRGSSDLPAALAEAFRILERTENPGRDVIVSDRRPALSLAARRDGPLVALPRTAPPAARSADDLVDRLRARRAPE